MSGTRTIGHSAASWPRPMPQSALRQLTPSAMRSRYARPSRNNSSSNDKKSFWSRFASTLAPFAAFLALATIALSLLGYGVALAVENSFDIPHAQIFSSTTDLLSLSTWAVVEVFPIDFLAILKSIHHQVWPYALLVSLACIAIWIMAIKRIDPKKIVARHTQKLRQRSPKEKERFFIQLTPLAGLAGFVWMYGFYLLVAAIAVVLVIAVVSIPAIGLSAGEKFLHKSVIEPEQCVPLRDLATRRKAYEVEEKRKASGQPKHMVLGANCVQIVRDGKIVTAGRVAISTTEYLVLFDPATGKVQRVPTKDAIVEPIGNLPAPADK